MNVPLLDLRDQYRPLREAIRAKFDQLADAQTFILGPEVEAFEQAIADRLGVHAIGVSSGTDAQLALLMALGIGPGDAVITTPYTFFATAGCIARTGARPVFADIDPVTYNLDPDRLAATLKATPNAKAIIPVHLFGCTADMDRILDIARSRGIPVLEDAAQALGARHPLAPAGAIGDAGWFSFYPTKNLGAFGDAGLVTCRDATLAAKLKAFRNHGMEPRYYHEWIGGNFRLDAIQAAVLNVKLPHLDTWNAARRAHAATYHSLFSDLGLDQRIELPAEPFAGLGFDDHHIYHQFVIRTPAGVRDRLRNHLRASGIGSEVYYPLPLHLQRCFAHLGYRPGDFPESERAAAETLALPIYPELTADQLAAVAESIQVFFAQ
jgi:dTDP-4-amino-4,6-dideoxygalactose transaminase